jgi:hypothetical protein
MGQTTDQIEADIQGRRDSLRSNFDELENKVKSVTDWRQRELRPSPSPLRKATDQRKGVALQTWGRIKSALIGLAATRITRFFEEMLPGFEEQLKKNGTARGESSLLSGNPEDSGLPRKPNV